MANMGTPMIVTAAYAATAPILTNVYWVPLYPRNSAN